jgi:hypothetical protein
MILSPLPLSVHNIENYQLDMNLPPKWKQWLAGAGVGTIIFFTVKGIITTSIIAFGAYFGFKGCS